MVLLLLFVAAALAGYGQDTLVYFRDITFSSEQERTALDAAINQKKPDYFTLFGVPGKPTPADAKAKYFDFLNRMGYEKWVDKKPDKRVKYVYESIHKTFLEKYEAKTLFSDIWANGDYNCVSATALYCMAFDQFGIPYSIKETPNHVYPVAYPKAQQVIVETTNPMVGSYAFNQQFKAQYVENLRKQKQISNTEMSSGEINALFDKHFFKEETDITLHQLVGIQYMNDGIFKIEAEQWVEGIRQFEKAYLFFPSEQVVNGLYVGYTNAFNQRTKKDTVHAALLGLLSRFKKQGVTEDMVKGEFARAVDNVLFDQGRKMDMVAYYNAVDRRIVDPELKKEIGFIYNYEFGRYYYNQGRYSESEPYFEKALGMRPNNQEAQSIYLQLLERNLRGTHNGKEALDLLNDVATRNPTLKGNNNFNTLMATGYLLKFMEDFDAGKPAEGDKYRLMFEEVYRTNADLNVNRYSIGQAYSTAAVYYFKKNQLAKAKVYIDKGLELVPDNQELQMRKRAIAR